MSAWDNKDLYMWSAVTPHYRTFTGLEFVGDPLHIHLPLYQEGQNMTMERLWKIFWKYGSDLIYLNIQPKIY